MRLTLHVHVEVPDALAERIRASRAAGKGPVVELLSQVLALSQEIAETLDDGIVTNEAVGIIAGFGRVTAVDVAINNIWAVKREF